LLQRLGIVDILAFGAETAQPENLHAAAVALEEPAITGQLKFNLTQGLPYAAALADALIACGHTTADIIKSPNNILGIEYLRAIRKHAPEMAVLPIRRIGSHYHEQQLAGTYSSATAIRNGLRRGLPLTDTVLAAMPDASSRMALALLASGWGPADPVRLETAILATLRRLSDHQLQALPELSEGLENRLRSAADRTGTLSALLLQVKSKRYPYSRLQRILAHLLLGTTADQLAEFDQAGPLYARVLALNSRGQVALRHIARHSEIPIITKTTRHLNSRIYHGGNFTPLQAMLAVDVAATDLFSLCLPVAENRKGGLDFCRSAFHPG
jgi:predicted nucleotidyltransferase